MKSLRKIVLIILGISFTLVAQAFEQPTWCEKSGKSVTETTICGDKELAEKSIALDKRWEDYQDTQADDSKIKLGKAYLKAWNKRYLQPCGANHHCIVNAIQMATDADFLNENEKEEIKPITSLEKPNTNSEENLTANTIEEVNTSENKLETIKDNSNTDIEKPQDTIKNSESDTVYKTTAAQLYQDYDANEVATDERIGGRPVEIAGKIESIDKDFMNNIVIHLNIGQLFGDAGLTMEASEKTKAIQLSKGVDVTIVCQKMVRIITFPQGSNCVFR